MGRHRVRRTVASTLAAVCLVAAVAACAASAVEPETAGAAPDSVTTGLPTAAEAGTPDSQVHAFVPTLLRLASGTRADVRPAGVDATGALVVPDDPRRVGWWTGGAKVGDPFGSVVVAGHLDSRLRGVGVLAELLDAQRGDVVAVEGDGVSAEYRVTEVFEVPKAELTSSTDVFRQDTSHRLVLVTCTGAFDTRTRSYADNLVVVATPVS